MNPIESSNLIISNINLEDEGEIKALTSKYISPYLKHANEIL